MIPRRFQALLITLAGITLLCQAGCAQLSPGGKAPDFTLPDLEGKQFKLSSCFVKPGKIVVLDIWATWCPPCRREIPVLINLNNKYKSKGVQFLGVALDNELQTVKEFVKEQKVNYTILHDPNGQKVGSLYKVRSIPQTYIIDRKGVIRYVHVGFREGDAEKIEKQIKTLLEEK